MVSFNNIIGHEEIIRHLKHFALPVIGNGDVDSP